MHVWASSIHESLFVISSWMHASVCVYVYVWYMCTYVCIHHTKGHTKMSTLSAVCKYAHIYIDEYTYVRMYTCIIQKDIQR